MIAINGFTDMPARSLSIRSFPRKRESSNRVLASTGTSGSCKGHYITIMADLASDPLAWRPVKAPSLAELEILAGEVFRRLPKQFRDLCAGVVIQVDDFPSDEVLEEMQAESEFDLLGLFQGVGLPFRAESAPVQMPNMIWLYRRPILDYWAEHDETLGAIVKHVLVHEIGHHFGLDRMPTWQPSSRACPGLTGGRRAAIKPA